MFPKTSVYINILAFSAVTYILFYVIYLYHPYLHIDELFHVPQGIDYCHYEFKKWNPKITTLPGLYLYSLCYQLPLSLLKIDVCNLYSLRLVSVSTSILNFFVIYFTLCVLRQNYPRNELSLLWTTWNISSFPPLYFWSFFYYTDMLSTFSVLLMYTYYIRKNFNKSAFIGLLCILVRQTNVIWVGFLILCVFADMLEKMMKRLKMRKNFLQIASEFTPAFLFRNKEIIIRGFTSGMGYSIVCFLFLLFLFVNGGIVVGDRQAHEPVLNLPQIFYFSLFTLCFSIPFFVGQVFTISRILIKHWKVSLIVMLICGVVVHFNTLVHPYLIADNRHLIFYIWKRIFEKFFLAKYLLIPIYIYSICFIFYSMEDLNLFAKIAYFFCLLLLLVPQKLLEFRYFLLPYIFFRLNIKHITFWQLLVESIFSFVINAAVLFIFLNKTFYWDDFSDVQRIGW